MGILKTVVNIYILSLLRARAFVRAVSSAKGGLVPGKIRASVVSFRVAMDSQPGGFL